MRGGLIKTNPWHLELKWEKNCFFEQAIDLCKASGRIIIIIILIHKKLLPNIFHTFCTQNNVKATFLYT